MVCSMRCRVFSRVSARATEKSRYLLPCKFAQEYNDATSSGVSFGSGGTRLVIVTPAQLLFVRVLLDGNALRGSWVSKKPGMRTRMAGIVTGNLSGASVARTITLARPP